MNIKKEPLTSKKSEIGAFLKPLKASICHQI